MKKVFAGDYIRWTRFNRDFVPASVEGVVRDVRRKFMTVEIDPSGEVLTHVPIEADMLDVITCPYCDSKRVRREYEFDCPNCGSS